MANLSYHKAGNKVEIIIRDENYEKIGHFKFDALNIKQKNGVVRAIRDKFGISLKVETDRDISWLNHDF